MTRVNRRRFLTTAAAAGGLSALGAARAGDKPNERIVLAVMGVNGRGRDLVRGFSAIDNVEIAYLCDPDDNVIGRALKSLAPRHKGQPRHERDIRRVLQDKTVTAIAVMQLAEQGLVDLDAPAGDYLRAYRLIPAKPGHQPPTVRQLLTHTAGLPQLVYPARAFQPGTTTSLDPRR